MPQQTVTLTEPRKFTLRTLFNQADIVALVRVASGDTENYGVTVYKATVNESFKGPASGETIYLGPYTGGRIGKQYVVFLHRAGSPRSPKSDANSSYGTIPYSEDFDEGYTTMEASYQCVFPGNEIAEKCDDAIRVSTDYITLKKSMSVFPPRGEVTDFGFRWVRERDFLQMLREFRDQAKR